ncbi:hypothetical protein D6D27_07365 [Aureobasidium pullulans]|nr:hypothetical protein D6D27_07365 [Aureobasidium pullulans]
MVALLTLPTEILCGIANHADDEALLNMRLSCKSLCEASARPFGTTYLTNRHHVPSEHSIQALVDIVMHPIFGSYVKSITITAMYLLPEKIHGDAASQYLAHSNGFRVPGIGIDKAFINSREYIRMMKQVFNKIRKLQNPVHIKICDDTEYGFGWTQMVDDPPRMYDHCYAEVLDRTLVAAIRADCDVRSLELSMHHYDFENLHDILEDLLSPTRQSLKLTIHCDRKHSRKLYSPYTCIYDQAEGSLELIGCDVYELARAKEDSTIKRTLAFLLKQNVTKLVLVNCHLCSAKRFRVLLSWGIGTLKTVCMTSFRPCRTPADAREHWSGIINVLSGHSGLESVVIEDLLAPRYWSLFHLPRDTQRYEVSGHHVAEQLRTLATIMATEPVESQI